MALYAGTSIEQRNLLTLQPNCRVKHSHGKRVGGWFKSEMEAIDLQPHAGNAAWLHHLLSYTGLCNSLDVVHSQDPAPIRRTFSRLAGLIAGGGKIFDKIKFLRSGVTSLRFPVERNSSSNENGSAPYPQFTSWKLPHLPALSYLTSVEWIQ